MSAACPAPGPDAPLVRSLTYVVDCNVQGLVQSGYAALFQNGAPLATLLTALLTLYVAGLGLGLLLGRLQLRVGDLAVTALKIGFVLALATQWETYQAIVYRALFEGPQQLAGGLLAAMSANHALALPPDPQAKAQALLGVARPAAQATSPTDVLDGLQRAFDQLQLSAAAYGQTAPVSASPFLGGAASGAALLTVSSMALLLSSLGVLLAAKVVLGVLLAVGPLFIALLLFDSTRGLFEGWLRATLGAAFAPLASLLLLAFGLTLLQPSLLQLEEAREKHLMPLGPVYGAAILVTVLTGVAAGLLVAGGLIAKGWKPPGLRRAEPRTEPAVARPAETVQVAAMQPRAARVAAAASALDRRTSIARLSSAESSLALLPASATAADGAGGGGVREITRTGPTLRTEGERAVAPPRLGQGGTRRSAGPRADRSGRGGRT